MYVDDILLCIPGVKNDYAFKNAFNNRHPRLKFTMDIEENSKISFLELYF
jgi:hypothetical protein